MMGFMPGLAYLGIIPKELELPSRNEPRVRVPAGSVAIAINLTNVYSLESPGGWHLLGRTPVDLFDLHRDPQALLTAGDRVRFRPVGSDAYDELKARMAAGDPPMHPTASQPLRSQCAAVAHLSTGLAKRVYCAFACSQCPLET